ncbi:MAG: biotin transporter BioY [Lachnospiraceae bacterium]|nr:biotin transporter BioY [Lachnospiraceae bacterium]
MSQNQKVRDLVYIAVFTAIIAVLAQISIPMPGGVPMTLQTFAVPLAGLVLGTKRGTLSALLYVLLGTLGVPVFAGLSGGPGIVLGVTGGFIVSFPIMALLAGLGRSYSDRMAAGAVRGYAVLIAFLILGAVANYIVGMIWFSVVTGGSLTEAFALCVAPFIPTSIIKIILVSWIGPLLRSVLIRAHVLEPAV